MTQRLLRQALPKHAARDKRVKFVCEWCQIEKRSVPGFANHLKQCPSRPVKLFSFSFKVINIININIFIRINCI